MYIDTKKPAFVIGAYASLPLEQGEQVKYYELLSQQEWINGLEIPYPGNLEDNFEWLMGNLQSQWDSSTITAIPGTMQNVWKNPDFGLASTQKEGRDLALEFTERIRIAVNKIADAKGSQLISKVQLHSAPTARANEQAFAESLQLLKEKDWAGANLVIEHCDAPRKEWKPEKGFLELESEIRIAQEVGVGIHLNWGRSCLENRDSETVARHIVMAAEANVLSGLVFSGVGPETTQYGYDWIDGHLPSTAYEPSSLMTNEVITHDARKACLAESIEYLGAKICVPKEADLSTRVEMLQSIYMAATN